MTEFVIKLLVSAVFALFIRVAFVVAGHTIDWRLAVAAGLVVVFGGMAITDAAESRKRRR